MSNIKKLTHNLIDRLKKSDEEIVNKKNLYLKQHAHNPIDRYPWGDESFTKAKQKDKPVFLSIGYS